MIRAAPATYGTLAEWWITDIPRKDCPELVTAVKTTNPACSLLHGASSNERVENSMQGTNRSGMCVGSSQPLRGSLWPFSYCVSKMQPGCLSVSDHPISVGYKHVWSCKRKEMQPMVPIKGYVIYARVSFLCETPCRSTQGQIKCENSGVMQ